MRHYTTCTVCAIHRLVSCDRWEPRARRVGSRVPIVRLADAALHGAQLGTARRLRERRLPDGGERAAGALQVELFAPLDRTRGALGGSARRRPHEPRVPPALRRPQRVPRAPRVRVRSRARTRRRRDAARDARQPRALPLLPRLPAHHSLVTAAHQKADGPTEPLASSSS